jgi:predicted aldo/keto reductase-like oxidoreductase
MNNSDGISRRGFLSTAASALVTAGLTGAGGGMLLAQELKEGKEALPENKLITRKLGRTDIEIPVISMGVMNASAPEVLQASYEKGIRHFDTAAYYQYGRNEQMVGNVIKKLGVRDKVIIGTKIYAPAQRRVPDVAAAKKKFLDLFAGSLSRLGMDYVDILYVHDVDNAEVVSDQAINEAMTELKRQGKVRATGVSTHSNMTEVINACTKGGFFDVVLTAFNFTMADDTELLTAMEKAAKSGMGIVAMKTLAGGGRWPNPESRRNYSTATISGALLKWVLRHDFVSTAIPGYDNFEHMEQDFAVAHDLEYTDEEAQLLADNKIKLGFGFCRQCRTCLASCPEGVEVPALMRTHMYAAQYANFDQARRTLDDIPEGKSLSACANCSTCSATCANTVDIARRIDELKMMLA